MVHRLAAPIGLLALLLAACSSSTPSADPTTTSPSTVVTTAEPTTTSTTPSEPTTTSTTWSDDEQAIIDVFDRYIDVTTQTLTDPNSSVDQFDEVATPSFAAALKTVLQERRDAEIASEGSAGATVESVDHEGGDGATAVFCLRDDVISETSQSSPTPFLVQIELERIAGQWLISHYGRIDPDGPEVPCVQSE